MLVKIEFKKAEDLSLDIREKYNLPDKGFVEVKTYVE